MKIESTEIGSAFAMRQTLLSAPKVLIYRIGSLGDMVVALPCFHLIDRAYPNSERILLTNFPVHFKAPAAADVLDGSGLVQGYFRYVAGTRNPLDFMHLALQIRRFNPDILIYLMPSRDPHLVSRDKRFFKWTCGVKCFFGLPTDGPLKRAPISATGLYEAEAVRLARTLEELGDAATSDLANWSLNLTESEKQTSRNVLGSLAGRPLIVCGPGTKMQAKDWGQDNWRHLVSQLALRYSEYGLAVIGAKEEEAVGNVVLAAWKGPKLNLCGRLTPRETGAVMEHASVFLGPDSGPMHLAACANVPCVIAFSARGLPGVWFPPGQRHKILYRQVSCFGCELESCIAEGRRCLTSITVNEMAAAVDSILSTI